MELILSQNLLFPLSSVLLVSAAQGFGGTILLFSLCFLGVHLAKITVRGWRLYDGTQDGKTSDKNAETTESKSETKPTVPEPIYYIVEKKRRRSKPSYGDPKEIRFK